MLARRTVVAFGLTAALAACGDARLRIRAPSAFSETNFVAPQAVAPLVAHPPTLAPQPSEPLAAEPPAAAPLPLAASLGVGQGEGLPPEVPAVPVAAIPQTMGLAEAIDRLATHHNLTSDVKIAGAPEVTISGEPPALSAGLSALLAAATPRHYAAIVRDRSGTPVRIIVSPYPIIGAAN